MTPASIYDGTIAIPMIDSFFKMYKSLFKPSYYAMDSGYDFKYIYEDIIKKYKAIPVITYNPRGSFAPPEGLDSDFDPICSGGYKLAYCGKDGDYIKFRCPHAVGKCDCPHGMGGVLSKTTAIHSKLIVMRTHDSMVIRYVHPLRGKNSTIKEQP